MAMIFTFSFSKYWKRKGNNHFLICFHSFEKLKNNKNMVNKNTQLVH